MKITSLEVFHIDESLWGSFWEREKTLPLVTPMSIYPQYRHPITTWHWPAAIVFVRVRTDTGVDGIGWAEDGVKAASTIIDTHLKQFVIGQNPQDVELIWDQLYKASIPYGRKGAAIEAISAIDIALWDCIGKALSVPVYNLLGGRVRDAVTLYASHLHAIDLERLDREARGYVAAGFKAVKMRFGFGPADGIAGMQKNEALVRTVRQAIGPEIGLMADAYMGWNLDYAIEMCRRLEPYDLNWLEEPLLPDDIFAYARLRQKTRIPIAAGEHEFTRWGHQMLLDCEAVDILQPDVHRVGGFTEIKKIGAQASARGVSIIPHTYSIPTLHVLNSQTNCPMGEYFPVPAWAEQTEPEEPLFLGEPQVENGEVRLGEAPGLGIEPAPRLEKLLKAF
jgi:L-rhamnonate dehydratase